MADNKILDELKKATQQVQVIASMEAKQRSEYLEAVSQQFFELQKTVHSIISEEGIILNNFDWEWIKNEKNDYEFEHFIDNKASLFAAKYGFSKETVKDILLRENEGCYRRYIDNTFYYFMLVPKKE